MVGGVEIVGHLELTLDDSSVIDVTAHGSRVRLEIGDLAPRRPTIRLVRSSATLARRLAKVLHARKLTLSITRNGAPFIELGSGVVGGPIARLFGLSRVRVHRNP